MTETYKNPPVPKGYTAVEGAWDAGFVIRRDSDGSELVWVPVQALPEDGIFADAAQRFGCRDYGYSGSAKGKRSDELDAQAKSVEKYGGFYLTRYCLSRDQDGALHAIKGVMPLTGINQFDAMAAARAFERGGEVSSHLPFAAEMDSALAWLLQSGQKTAAELSAAVITRNTRAHQDKVTETGSDESLYAVGFYDLAGTVDEWTQDQTDGAYLWGCNPCAWPTTSRCYFAPYACYTYTGLRAALYLR